MLTGYSVVGGGEGGQGLDVPEVDGLVYACTGHSLLLPGIGQALDVVSVGT